MKTKTLLQTTGLCILMMLLTTLLTHSQIYLQGLAANNEGIACWDADGSGPEPEAYGHEHPFGYGSALFYSASRDYIDSNPDAAMCRFMENITGFPLFVQAMDYHGFVPEQVKVKVGLGTFENDTEGMEWFTIDDTHYQNRYGSYLNIYLLIFAMCQVRHCGYVKQILWHQ